VTTQARTQVEHAGQHLFRNADAVVLHPEHGGTVVLLDGQADMTFFRGIPRSINKQVGHDSNQSSDIALRSYRRLWGDDLQCVPKSLDQRTADPNGQTRNVRKISKGLSESKVATPDSAEIANILHQAPHEVSLLQNDCGSPFADFRCDVAPAQELRRVSNGRQRAAKLVGKRRQDLVPSMVHVFEVICASAHFLLPVLLAIHVRYRLPTGFGSRFAMIIPSD